MQEFLNVVYQNGVITTINKLTRVTTVSLIDHILRNNFVDGTFQSDIFKTDISDHFPVIFLIPSVKLSNKDV